MAKNTADAATVYDMPLFPYGSGDMSAIDVQVGLRDVKTLSAEGYAQGYPTDEHILHFICASAETATLRITRLTY